MDDFRVVKTAAGWVPFVVLLPLLLVVSSAQAATQKQASSVKATKPVASSDFYHYGLVCGQNDAQKGQDSTGSLSVTGSAMAYISDIAHRQELPAGQALALVQAAKKAPPAQLQTDLKAFLSGYQDGWKQMSTPIAPVAQSGKAAPENGQSSSESSDDDPSLQNLRTLGEAVRLYLSDHNRTFPRMISAKVANKYFQGYLLDDHAFYDPATREPYQPNPSLEGVHLQAFQNRDKMVVYYEQNPGSDGTRGVLFVDGSVARIPADQWPKVKKDSDITDQP